MCIPPGNPSSELVVGTGGVEPGEAGSTGETGVPARAAEGGRWTLLHAVPDPLLVIHWSGMVEFVNSAAAKYCDLGGAGREHSIHSVVHPEDHRLLNRLLEGTETVSGQPPRALMRMRSRVNEWIEVEALVLPYSEEHLVLRIRQVGRNSFSQRLLDRLTEADPADSVLADVTSLLAEALSCPVGYWIGAPEEAQLRGLGDYLEPPNERLFGDLLKAGAYTGRMTFVADVLADPAWSAVAAAAEQNRIRAVCSVPITAGGKICGGLVAISAEAGPMPMAARATIERVVKVASLALRRAQIEDELAWQQRHDSLTGLPNRDELIRLARRSRAPSQADGAAALVISVDRFRTFSDCYGRQAGDVLLARVARLIRRVVRPGDLLGRIGSDSFAVICAGVEGEGEVQDLARRVLAATARPIHTGGVRTYATVSIGTAGGGRPDDAESLLADAELAMCQASMAGGNRSAAYETRMRQQAIMRHALENDLREAIDRDQLVLYYQPLIDLRHGGVSAVEALIRWHHPQRGVIAPDDFLPIASAAGLMVPIGYRMLDQACRDLVRLRQETVNPELRLFFNMDGAQLADGAVVPEVHQILLRHGLDARALRIEITEHSALGTDADGGADAVTNIRMLRQMGVGVGLDDFGTGQSSLARLNTIEIDFVKLDKSFTEQVTTGGEVVGIVSGIMLIADALGYEKIAEGVETPEQAEYMYRAGCDFAQGYRYSAPVPIEVLVGAWAVEGPDEAVSAS